jgi:ankyrin repeat protein
LAAAAGVFRLLLIGFSIVNALDRQDLKSVMALVNRGASVNAQGNNGGTPLLLASNPFQPAALRWLLHRGGNPDVRDDMGFTPLGWAVTRHDGETVRLLLNAGAQPDQRFLRTTPLEYAAVSGDPGMTRLLLERGANVNLRDLDARTALEAVRSSSLTPAMRERLILQLRSRGAKE